MRNLRRVFSDRIFFVEIHGMVPGLVKIALKHKSRENVVSFLRRFGATSLASPEAELHPHGASRLRRRPYFVENTRSHLNSEVKRRKARLVPRWGTARENLRVLTAFASGLLERCFCTSCSTHTHTIARPLDAAGSALKTPRKNLIPESRSFRESGGRVRHTRTRLPDLARFRTIPSRVFLSYFAEL